MKKSLLLRIVKAIIPCFSLLFTASLFNHSFAQNVKGEPIVDGITTLADSAFNNSSNRTNDFGVSKPAKIGDFVWSDTNKNGIQDGGELGVSGVVINLYVGSNTTPIATATTLSDGKYLFDNLIAGTYTVEFVKASIGVGNDFTKLEGTRNGEENSNADLTTGKSAPITVAAGESNLTINAGIIGNCAPTAIGTIAVPNLCAGQTLTLRATSTDPLATYTWSRTPSGFTATTQEITLPNLIAGSSVYTVLITNSNLCTSALTANVVVNPIPIISVNSVSNCSGTTGTLTVTGATSYVWTGPNGAFTTSTANLSVNQQGVYTVTGTSNGCTAIATTSVTIYPKMALTATGAAICLGGSGTISVLPAGLNYVWTGPFTFTSALQTPTITNASDSNKGTYTVTVTDGNTCVSTATVAVTVGTNLTVTPTSNSPVCEGTRLDLSITGGTGAKYLWTSPNGFTTSMQNPFTTSSTNADNGVWTVAVENADGCKGIGSISVVINQALTGVIATASAPECAGGTINLTSTPAGAKSYEWSGTPSFTSSVQNPVITSAMANNYTFTVKVTNVDGCTALATASTAIYTAPDATASSNSAICVGSPINLSVSTSAIQFAWTGPNNFTASTKTPTILKAISTSSGIYSVIVTNENSCTAIATTNVVIYSSLSGADDLSICAPVATAQLTVISGSTWKVEPTNPTVATVDVNGKVSGLTVNGSYVFYTTNASGCNDTVKVFRNEKLDAGNDVMICSPKSTAKLLKLNTGQTWKYFADGQIQAIPTIDINGNVSGATQDGIYLFILEQEGITYCADTVAVIRKAAPMAGADQTVKMGSGICEPLKIAKLQASTTGQTWSVASNSVGFGTVAIDANGTITKMETNGIYTFVLTQGECIDSVKVERIAKPVTGPDIEICANIKTVKLPTAPTDMTWSSISTNPVGTLINATTGEVSGLTIAGEYKFILKNLGGCTDTVSVKTKAIPTFDVNQVQATCTIGAANSDAKMIVSSTDATATYDYSEGITYTGTRTFATGTAITIAVLGLANPTFDKSYTVRVFNITGCYTDKTVILKPRICECKPDICMPYTVIKIN